MLLVVGGSVCVPDWLVLVVVVLLGGRGGVEGLTRLAELRAARRLAADRRGGGGRS